MKNITACGECCANCNKYTGGVCPGCVAADGIVPEWAESGRCRIHACAKEHGVACCAMCAIFPCQKLDQMMPWKENAIDILSRIREKNKKPLPTIEEAKAILIESVGMNNGPWGEHCLSVAHCAREIAKAVGLDENKAWLCGMFHDIGRRFVKGHMQHIYYGWKYMTEMGYPELARICLTHSFVTHDFNEYIGNVDTTEEQTALIKDAIENCVYDDYDRLAQLCDCIGAGSGVVDMKDRMDEVERRYGYYPDFKREAYYKLYDYFEAKAGRNLYEICQKGSFSPERISK